MIELRPPAENPAGDGPADVNPLLDALRAGEVLKESSYISGTFHRMGEGERIERVSFAGSPPAVRKRRVVDPLTFALAISQSMGAGLSEFSLTDREELEQRERDHRVALAFWMWRRMERDMDRGGDGG